MPPAMPNALLGWSFKVGRKRVVPNEENLDPLSWSQQIIDRRPDAHCSRRLMPFLMQSPNPQSICVEKSVPNEAATAGRRCLTGEGVAQWTPQAFLIGSPAKASMQLKRQAT